MVAYRYGHLGGELHTYTYFSLFFDGATKYRTKPQKLGEGSPQPGKTMGSPGTLPLMGGHP